MTVARSSLGLYFFKVCLLSLLLLPRQALNGQGGGRTWWSGQRRERDRMERQQWVEKMPRRALLSIVLPL